MPACVNHEEREADFHCRQCSRPVCADCLVESDEACFCSGACAKAYADFMARAEELAGRETGGRRWRKVAGLLIFALAVAAFYLARRFFLLEN